MQAGGAKANGKDEQDRPEGARPRHAREGQAERPAPAAKTQDDKPVEKPAATAVITKRGQDPAMAEIPEGTEMVTQTVREALRDAMPRRCAATTRSS